MTSTTHLPPLDFDDGGLRIVLLPEVEILSSARYSESDQHAGDSESDDDGQGDVDDNESDHDSNSTPPPPSIPVHPIPALQDAFAESLHEVMSGTAVEKPKLRALDAQGRREAVLAQGIDEPAFDSTWRLRPGQSQHELAKLIAQISFGVYLMLNGMANNNTQVVTILQGHIDEVDEFLEVTIEDLEQVEMDLKRRIDHLMLPMSNVTVFEQLLEDRKFRTEILEGNEKIEHILARTNVAMKQWDDDIEAGLQTSNIFINWLNEQSEGTWRGDQPDVTDIFDAMSGNAEGWLIAFEKISDSTHDINSLIIRLMNIISEMEKKAGEASRRTWASITPFSAPPMPKPLDVPPPKLELNTANTAPHHAPSRSIAQDTVRSGSSDKRPPSSIVDADDTSTIDFPLPGGLPLLPPFRSTRHTSNTFGLNSPQSATTTATPTFDSPQYTPQSTANTFGVTSPQSMQIHLRHDSVAETEESEPETETGHSDHGEEAVFLLQPRTYTPQPPAPLPSPLIKDEPGHNARSGSQSTLQSLQSAPFTPADTKSMTWRDSDIVQRRTSLRDRVSLKMMPPGDIHIPPRSLKGMEMYAHSPGTTTPQTMRSHQFDSAYESDAERHGRHPSGSSSNLEMSPPQLNVMPSPRSDRQRYHPVHASPHSPLQQRPHTAVGHGQSMYIQGGPSLVPPRHLRNKPSNAGMSTLSNVQSISYDDGTAQSVRTTKTVDKQLKKKKSAFGWLKKAFSMDEEERAAYEARKAMQYEQSYYNADPPKFLDGKRLR
ncbi:hypothetical protein TrVFT333_002973 [Trichoderma virens FT-333]|nr:hypothetical protein TrVFT333_002973 [Trichoderma virens FT-333]